MKWTADLIIALVLIVGCFILIFSGIDGEVKSILTLAAGWCFGNIYIQRTVKGAAAAHSAEVSTMGKKEDHTKL